MFSIFSFKLILSFFPQQEDDDDSQPLSLAWPDTPRKKFTYLIILPIVFPLWATLPDVRNPVRMTFFTFIYELKCKICL